MKINRFISVTILLVLLYFVYFLNLGRLPLRLWDESRLAHNAYNMSKDGDFIVTHIGNEPEMWNVKPPLMIWSQVLFIKALGPNETALRLPSAICGLLTSLLLLYFCSKHLGKFAMGFFAALIIATTNRYIDDHGVRFGEYEGMLIFFVSMYALYFFLWFEKRNPKHLYIATIALIAAVLTKGIAGLFLAPIIAITGFFYRDIATIFKTQHFYICITLFLFFTAGYYFLRESQNPGYINAVLQNEIGGRYFNPVEKHEGSFWMYWDYMKNRDLVYWLPWILGGVVTGFLSFDSLIKRLTLFAFSNFVFLFFMLSSSESKLHWYIYPSYPFLALIASYFIWVIYRLLFSINTSVYIKVNVIPYFFAFILFLSPYDSIVARTYKPQEAERDEQYFSMGRYLQKLIRGREKLREPLKIFYTEYDAHLTFYTNILLDRNVPVSHTSIKDLKVNDLVACSLPQDHELLNKNFETDTVMTDVKMIMYRIKSLKNEN